MNIVIAGAGYVGLSLAILLSSSNSVNVLDVDMDKVELINKGVSPILDEEFASYFASNKVGFTATMDKAVYKDADLVIVATPTNFDANKNKFDTSSVTSVLEDVKEINPKAWVLIKSTVGVGFTLEASRRFHNVLFSPEFLREGKALEDNRNPSRIIVGVPYKKEPYLTKAKEIIDLLSGFASNAPKSFLMGSTEAESVKLFSNAYLAMRVAYFNELDTFALSKGLDSLDIIKGVSADPRIGDFYNNPSFGYGGYCLPKDAAELAADFLGIPEELISATLSSNSTRKRFIVREIMKKAHGGLIGIYRLSMKRGSSDLRQSSVVDVVALLKEEKANLIIYEPSLKEDTYMGYEVISSLEEFASKAEVILANRVEEELSPYKDKVYTRDLLKGD